MDFPLLSVLDVQACYDFLLRALHPAGLACPACGATDHLRVHRAHRAPVRDYRCLGCGRVFNAWTESDLQGTQRGPAEIVLILRGIAQNAPTAQLARELGCSRRRLLDLRHRWQQLALLHQPPRRLSDATTEADEMYQNAGEKGRRHPDPLDPPRRRGNRRRGLGTWANDRPPIAGVVGRESHQLRLEVVDNPNRALLQGFVGRTTRRGAMVYTDEAYAYDRLHQIGRRHEAVTHRPGQRVWARDADGDGVREVHNNTLEGIWVGLRNFLRPFRGINKWYEDQYVGIFEWAYNLKTVTSNFVRVLVGLPSLATDFVP